MTAGEERHFVPDELLHTLGRVVTRIVCPECNRDVGSIRLDETSGRLFLATTSSTWRKNIVPTLKSTRPDLWDVQALAGVRATSETHCRRHGWLNVVVEQTTKPPRVIRATRA